MRSSLIVCCALSVVVAVTGSGQAQDRARPTGTSSERFEVSSIKAVRPTLVNTISALQKQDIAGAKAAFEAYDRAWNGIEVYINFRYIDMYNLIEHTYQDRITKALNDPSPNVPAITADAQAMLAKFDETVGMIEKAAPISPLFDDVARLRIARANLLPVIPAMKAGDFTKAREGVTGFRRSWPNVESLVKVRSQEAHDAIEKSLADVETALKQDKPNAEQITPMVSALNLKYNSVVAEINKEARAAK
jgi:hypothetical protein